MSLVINSDEVRNCLGYMELLVISLSSGLDRKEINFSQASRSCTLTARQFRPAHWQKLCECLYKAHCRKHLNEATRNLRIQIKLQIYV